MNQKQFYVGIQCLFALSLLLLPHAGDSRPSRKAASAARASRQANTAAKQVFHYVAGRHPYVLVIPEKVLSYTYPDRNELPYSPLSCQTPRGLVSLYWRDDDDGFVEGGKPVAHPGVEMNHNAYVTQLAVITPSNLPIVLEAEEPEIGWLHVNGHVMSYFAGKSQSLHAGVRRIRLPGGLNLVERGAFDAE